MNKNKKNLAIIVIILTIASLAFRFINQVKLEQTTILFIGVPALITLLLIRYTDTPKSIFGITFKTITLFLLITSILLGEGTVCIIMMAPLFYGIAALIVLIFQLINRKKKNNKLFSFVLIPMLIMTSQVYNINSLPELNVIETSVTVNKNQTIDKLNQHPDFLNNYPSFFKLGFPEPVSIIGTGLEIGDFRKIDFLSNTKGIGTLHLKIIDKTNSKIVFEVINDSSHINHWLSFKEVSVLVKNNSDNTATITWSTKFNCDLGPSWYFNPLEKYAVEVMNIHLINSFFNG